MKNDLAAACPDNTAVRTALWRALHVQLDAKPSILDDEIGLLLANPPLHWQDRPDMKFTRRLRASIVARARFIEDLIIEKSKEGIAQYVILGSGLDTFAQRRPDIAAGLQIFEIDQPDMIAWKKQRLKEVGLGLPNYLHLIPVDFEKQSWADALNSAGFDPSKPVVIVCTGVTLYLTREAILTTLQTAASFAPGSVLAITFYLPPELLEGEDRALLEMSQKGARASGTPMISFFSPEDIVILAKEAGLQDVHIVSTQEMIQWYFAQRTDGFTPAEGEVFLLAHIPFTAYTVPTTVRE